MKYFNSNNYAVFLIFYITNYKCDLTYGVEWPFAKNDNGHSKQWQGKWFPQSPDKLVDDNPTVEYSAEDHIDLSDPHHGIKMGIPNNDCDNGKVNITLDWDESPINYTCYEDKYAYMPNINIHPILQCDNIPKGYMAPHRCMNTNIGYDENIPTFGAHRPLWPKWGEYIFLPKQRWLHSLEHGGVVMLYHPCANKKEVKLLRELVRGCLYRHIITPYTLLQPDQPLALVVWGKRLQMSKVSPQLVTDFIKSSALRGPEQKYQDGQFDFGITEHAKIVSDEWDHNLCPDY